MSDPAAAAVVPAVEPTIEPTATPAGGSDPEKGAGSIDGAAAGKTVPLSALEAERTKRQEADAELADFRKAKQTQLDAEAAAKGDVTAAHAERDTAKAAAEAGEGYAKGRLETVTEALSDDAKALLEKYPESASIYERLGFAEQLMSTAKVDPTKPGFGSPGGPAKSKDPDPFPGDVTDRVSYHTYLANLSNSDPAALLDSEKRAQRQKAAKERGWIN